MPSETSAGVAITSVWLVLYVAILAAVLVDDIPPHRSGRPT
ncbi:MAG TPA: hypothetical protein VKP52_12365 [Pseudolabrys sp.]|nr:hypothetical protein [Pseudolabrys sp.]